VLTEEVRVTMLTYGALIEQSLLGVSGSQRFCRNEEGRLGQVRTEAREGDLFVVIVGAEVPYLLRPDAEKEGVYALIGDAFLLGVMQGEALLDDWYETVDIVIEQPVAGDPRGMNAQYVIPRVSLQRFNIEARVWERQSKKDGRLRHVVDCETSRGSRNGEIEHRTVRARALGLQLVGNR
jgi:hypothetical protein